MKTIEDIHAESLRLAIKQIGPWTKGKLTKHHAAVLATAAMYRVYIQEGYSPAMEIVNNKIRTPPILTLVKKA